MPSIRLAFVCLLSLYVAGCHFVKETAIEETVNEDTAVNEAKEPRFIDLQEPFAQSVAFSPDGKTVLTANWNKTARIWDAETGEELKTITGHTDNWMESAAFSPDGTKIVTACRDKTVRIWDTESGKELKKIEWDTFFSKVHSAAFSPDGKRIITADSEGVTQLWDAESGEELMVLKDATGAVSTASFSPDGKKIVRAHSFAPIRIYDTESGQVLKTMTKPNRGGHSLATFSPDGKRIVAVYGPGNDEDGYVIQIFDAESGKVLIETEKNRFWIRCVAFSADGKKIVSIGNDPYTRIWNAESGKLLRTLQYTTGSSAAFSPDGKKVVMNGGERGVRIWILE